MLLRRIFLPGATVLGLALIAVYAGSALRKTPAPDGASAALIGASQAASRVEAAALASGPAPTPGAARSASAREGLAPSSAAAADPIAAFASWAFNYAAAPTASRPAVSPEIEALAWARRASIHDLIVATRKRLSPPTRPPATCG